MKQTKFSYSKWRHGGYYVHNVRYPNGAIGCVSNNYEDRKWRVVCDPAPFDQHPTFSSRDDAAGAEVYLARMAGVLNALKRASEYLANLDEMQPEKNHGSIGVSIREEINAAIATTQP